MKTKFFSLSESQEWESHIRAFSKYDVYYLPSYSKAFHGHGDGDPMLLYFEKGGMKAATVVMKRDIENTSFFSGRIPKETFFDLSTPYGYGGFIVEGNINTSFAEELKKEYSLFCQRSNIVSEFVRFHPILQNHTFSQHLFHITNIGETISMDLSSLQSIWDNLTSKNRNMIRKAKKSGVEVFWGRSNVLFSEFKKIYDATMKHDNANDYYFFDNDFYKSILKDLRYNSLVFYAAYEGKTIATSIILICNKKMHYHLSGSLTEYRYLAPSNLLLYEAACWGSENGFSCFHLGGGLGSKTDSLYKFKKAFNRQSENVFYVGKKIFDEEKYNMLMKIRTPDFLAKEFSMQSYEGFFPQYRKPV